MRKSFFVILFPIFFSSLLLAESSTVNDTVRKVNIKIVAKEKHENYDSIYRNSKLATDNQQDKVSSKQPETQTKQDSIVTSKRDSPVYISSASQSSNIPQTTKTSLQRKQPFQNPGMNAIIIATLAVLLIIDGLIIGIEFRKPFAFLLCAIGVLLFALVFAANRFPGALA